MRLDDDAKLNVGWFIVMMLVIVVMYLIYK
jgi:hypothetical protein